MELLRGVSGSVQGRQVVGEPPKQTEGFVVSEQLWPPTSSENSAVLIEIS